MLQFIREHNFTSVYPYAGVALRIFLCTQSTNCTVEHSFSTLKIIKATDGLQWLKTAARLYQY